MATLRPSSSWSVLPRRTVGSRPPRASPSRSSTSKHNKLGPPERAGEPQTTARYAHLFDNPLRKATERAGAILAPRKRRPATWPNCRDRAPKGKLCDCRQRPRNTHYQAGATPYLSRTFTGWIAPACGWRTHSITSSAHKRTEGGIVSSRDFAVPRFRIELCGVARPVSRQA
jgi:hypothetical protein